MNNKLRRLISLAFSGAFVWVTFIVHQTVLSSNNRVTFQSEAHSPGFREKLVTIIQHNALALPYIIALCIAAGWPIWAIARALDLALWWHAALLGAITALGLLFLIDVAVDNSFDICCPAGWASALTLIIFAAVGAGAGLIS